MRVLGVLIGLGVVALSSPAVALPFPACWFQCQEDVFNAPPLVAAPAPPPTAPVQPQPAPEDVPAK